MYALRPSHLNEKGNLNRASYSDIHSWLPRNDSVSKKSNGKRQLRLGKGIWLKTGDVKLWTQTHGERKNRVQSFIKQPININWIRLCFMWVSSITNNHYYSTLISISKSVSCHFSHLFIPFISSLSFFFFLKWKIHIKLFSSS